MSDSENNFRYAAIDFALFQDAAYATVRGSSASTKDREEYPDDWRNLLFVC